MNIIRRVILALTLIVGVGIVTATTSPVSANGTDHPNCEGRIEVPVDSLSWVIPDGDWASVWIKGPGRTSHVQVPFTSGTVSPDTVDPWPYVNDNGRDQKISHGDLCPNPPPTTEPPVPCEWDDSLEADDPECEEPGPDPTVPPTTEPEDDPDPTIPPTTEPDPTIPEDDPDPTVPEPETTVPETHPTVPESDPTVPTPEPTNPDPTTPVVTQPTPTETTSVGQAAPPAVEVASQAPVPTPAQTLPTTGSGFTLILVLLAGLFTTAGLIARRAAGQTTD